MEPLAVFADEPTNDLDSERAAWIGSLLFGLPLGGKALVLVTHDARLASKASRSFQLADGGLRAQSALPVSIPAT